MAGSAFSSTPTPRSPIRDEPKSPAGFTLLNELFVSRVGVAAYALGIGVMGAVLIAAVWSAWWLKPEWTPWAVTVMAGLFFASAVWFVFQERRGSENIELGLKGELTVAQMLEQMGGFGYKVLHDVAGEREGTNIDHVLIGPGGVFTIETKTRSKVGNQQVNYDGERITIDGQDRSEALGQARACRDDVRRRISRKLGRDVQVRAIVVYVGWWVKEPRGVSGPNDVWVLNENRVKPWVQGEPERLPEVAFAQIETAIRG